MEFSILERVQLLGITAGLEGNLTTLRIIRDFRSTLSFSEAELAALNFQHEGEQIKWNPVVGPKAVEVGPALKAAVAGAFKKLEQRESLTLDLLPLYERFIES
jgi:hypothetical protein